MAVLDIRLVGDPVLRKKAEPVKKVTRRIVKLLRDMEETMYAANGVGLAGPQVGQSLRVIVVDVGDGPVHLINPVIEDAAGSEVDREGCLSIPGIVGYVERFERVRVSAINEKGKPVRFEAEGYFARALQHEIDHLDGILIIDKATSIAKIPDPDEEQVESGNPSGDESVCDDERDGD